MRMILVHGINQQGKSAQQMLDVWLGSLRVSYEAHGPDPLGKLSRIDAAFYGDELEKLSAGWVTDEAIALGSEAVVSDYEDFARAALKEIARRGGATEQQIDSVTNEDAIGQGNGIHKEWVKAIARLIETLSPLHGVLAMRVLGQAHAYIRNQKVHDQINALVRPLFEDDEPMIVISHSLGTIVSYSLLREFAKNGRPRQSPLFVTLGSPLGIDSVRKGFAVPRVTPDNVKRWVNCADSSDFVALRPKLTEEMYGPGIINYTDFHNGDDSHSITAYLNDPRVAEVIAEAIP